jgi:hypothetical protein
MGFSTARAIVPALGPQAYKSFSMRAPIATHHRRVTCAEAECDAWRHGWVTLVDVSTSLGQQQAAFIRGDRTRRCHEQRAGDTLIRFVFGPGQEGFAGKQHTHYARIARPPLFVVAEGDWRGNPRGIPVRVVERPEDWVDEFATHQDRLAAATR